MTPPALSPLPVSAPGPAPDPASPVDPATPAGLFAAAMQQAAPGSPAEPVERVDPPASLLAPVGALLAGPSLAPAAAEAAEAAVPSPAATAGAAASVGDAAPVSAWPPPGLSSLFPAAPLFAGHAAAPATPGATAPALPTAATPVLPAAPAAVVAPAPGLAAATVSTPVAAGARAGAGATGTRAGVAAAALAATPTPIAAALAMAGRGLALPSGLERRGEGETSLAPTSASVGALATGLPPALSGTSLPRLDLHAAFPQAPLLQGARFSEDLGARLQWMAGRGGGEATLRVAPEGLGPVEIRLSLEGDRVDLGFLATQAETRHALEQALPRLRELLAQQGLSLGQADVGERPPPRGGEAGDQAFPGGTGKGGQGRGGDAGEAEVRLVRPPPRASDGLLDLYA